jgi:hypothetical protein
MTPPPLPPRPTWLDRVKPNPCRVCGARPVVEHVARFPGEFHAEKGTHPAVSCPRCENLTCQCTEELYEEMHAKPWQALHMIGRWNQRNPKT